MIVRVRPEPRSICLSSSMNGKPSLCASSEPSVDFPAPRRPIKAMRECRDAESTPPNFSRRSLWASRSWRGEVSSRMRWIARTLELRAGRPPPESQWRRQAHGQPDAAGQLRCCRDRVRPLPKIARTARILWRAAEETFHDLREQHGAFRRVVANKSSQVRNENSGAQPVWLCEMPTELLLIFWMRNGVAFPGKSIAREEQ